MLPEARCDGVRRRDLLHVGVLTALGLSLEGALRAQAREAGGVRSCILIWLDGGPSHLDTFDPKPEAPAEVRGEFRAMPTRVNGIQVCEHLPRMAAVMDRVALVRSLTHELGNHDTGSQYLLTGRRPSPVVDYPSLASLVSAAAAPTGDLPPYVAVPDAVPAGGAGVLGGAHAPFSLRGDPSRPDYRVRDLQPPPALRMERLGHREAMLRSLDRFSRIIEEGPETRSRDAYFQQAYRLVTSPGARAALDLSRESPALRSEYGRGRLGASCLLARRLVEAGARFVTVVDRGWDTHQQIFKALPDAFFPGSGKLPALDRACSALLRDLEDRGLLSGTLVVLLGEFGRTPKLNAAGGRDHWPRAGFALLAGAGVRGGQAIGRTDAFGELPAEDPVSPEDLAFTLLRLLGVDPSAEYVTPDGRPLRRVQGGAPIRGLV